jgi:cell fate regulator YaaT (PSP1 superfamily)
MVNVESTLERLTEIAGDLKTIIAVHDQRIQQQEKETLLISTTVERRREELDKKLKDVYDTIREQDNHILKEICDLREESNKQHKILSEKISALEKYIFIAIGGGIVITWILTNLANYLKLLQH